VHTSCDVKDDWGTFLVMLRKTGHTPCDVKEDRAHFL
jgi:hypothetical protein